MDADGNIGAVAKPTGWMTNSLASAKRVGVERRKDREHARLAGGRSKAAERYPVGLVNAILAGMRDQMGIGQGLHALEVGPTLEELEPIESAAQEEVQEFFDGTSGAKLDPKLVQ